MKHLFEFIADPFKKIDVLLPISLVINAPADVKVPEIQKLYIEKINQQWADEKVTSSLEDFIKVSQHKYSSGPEVYIDHSLSKEETLTLRVKSKEHGVSVNAALLASILMAKKSKEIEPTSDFMGFAVDVRNRLTKAAGEACNLLASGAMVNPDYESGMEFWDIAKNIHDKTRNNKLKEMVITEMLHILRSNI